MKIYYYHENHSVLGISTEETEQYTDFLDVSSLEEFMGELSKLKISCEDSDVIENLNEIFLDDESSHEETFSIKHWVSNRSFGELVDMYKYDEITVPNMQRKFVWTSSKSSRLIESIILGLPIPPLFLLEVSDNKYEIIDGYQRLTTLFNFIEGNPWTGKKVNGRNIASRLSRKNIIKDIRGKTFEELSSDQKTKIKRSTIPLVEFRQLNPGDFSSKYLIFERINTGSEKLNGMQIRKSLAYGSFMENLYELANSDNDFLSLFSSSQIKKDMHVEALMRIIVMSDIYYKRFIPKKEGIKNILDEYGEENKEDSLKIEKISSIFENIRILLKLFGPQKIFRRVNSDGEYEGMTNFAIMESIVGVMTEENIKLSCDFEKNYVATFTNIWDSYILDEADNPFSASTGSISSIINRFEIIRSLFSI
ncbi:DUF262 domain-containing protein [Streptococcus hyovaginalis]|uniref:DUF262 domain-containing protein n=1 Tax=Streptococcus hyovaginalis TaxID=149015 RepID=UPI003B3B0BA5